MTCRRASCACSRATRTIPRACRPPDPGMDPTPYDAAIAADLEHRTRALAEAAHRAHDGAADPDPEAIHDLRVAARRLVEALALWRGRLDLEAADDVRRRVRRLRQRIGPVRADEVRAADLRARHADADLPLRLALESIVRRIERRVVRGREDAARAARPSRVAAIVAGVQAAAATLAAPAFGRPDPLPPAIARSARRRDEAWRALARAAGHDASDTLLHEARIAIKKDRYASEALGAVHPTGAPALTDPRRIAALRRVQHALGTVHDRAELIAMLEQRARRWRADGRVERAQALSPLLERIAAERRTALLRARRAIAALAEPPTPATEPVPAPPAREDRAAAPGAASAVAPPRFPIVRLPGRPRES